MVLRREKVRGNLATNLYTASLMHRHTILLRALKKETVLGIYDRTLCCEIIVEKHFFPSEALSQARVAT